MIKIKFDLNRNPIPPTLVLATRNGSKIGAIEAYDIDIKDSLEESCEMNFKVYKEVDGVKSAIWDDLTNFKLVWWQEQDAWFDATVEFNDDEETVKTVFCTQLGQSELSLINLYNYEINTEADILSPTYNANYPTILYRPSRPQSSLLHRLLEKAPHYSIAHVDDSIKDIQRTYSFNGTSIYDALQQVAEDIGAFVKFSPIDGVDSSGHVLRQIAFYDAMYYCNDCHERFEFLPSNGKCPNCGKTNISDGYGEDTTIFITKDELATSIGLSANTDEVRNCYRLTAGDDLMNATIRNINANNSDYMWYLDGDSTADMSDALKTKLSEYNTEYANALKANYPVDQTMPDQSGQPVDLRTEYNRLVTKYQSLYTAYIRYAYTLDDGDLPSGKALNKIPAPSEGITTYKKMVWLYYDTIDFELFVKSALLPSTALKKTTAYDEAVRIKEKVKEVGVTSLKNVADTTVNNAVMEMVNATIHPGYTASIIESSVTKSNGKVTWRGRLKIASQSDETDVREMTSSWAVTVTDDYEEFVLLKIKRINAQNKTGDLSVDDLFEQNLNAFKTRIQEYSLDELSNMQKIAQAAVDIIMEQGLDDTWAAGGTLYDLYTDYYNKMDAIDEEMSLREYELAVITNMQICLQDFMNQVKNHLNLENYLGAELWIELSMFRREEEYSNSNYISDGMTNKEICKAAQEFMDKAEISARNAMENQYNINTSLNNLLQYDKFLPWTDYFAVGNWMRVLADNRVYKLRLLDYSINFNDFTTIDVNFSEAVRVSKGAVGSAKTLQDMINKATKTVTITNTIDVSKQFVTALNDTATTAVIAQNASTKTSDSAGARNLLMDTNAPSLTKQYAAHNRYFSTATQDHVTPSYFTLTKAAPISVQYGAKFTVSSTYNGYSRGLAWYSGGLVGLTNGEKYTLSCYARVSSGTNMVLWLAYSRNETKARQYTVSSSEWRKFSWSFTYNASDVGDEDGTGCRIYVGCTPTYAGTLETCGYQLERGNMSSDYQRSPEDSSAEATAKATEIVTHLDQKLMARYGVCQTASGTAAKIVSINNFTLEEGSMVAIRFVNANTVASPTLNVSSTGAHLIRLNKKLIPKPADTKSYTSTSSDGTTKTVTNANNNPSSGWVASSLVHLIYTKGTGTDSTHDISTVYYWDIIDTAALTKIDNILTQNIVGTNSYINLAQGQFDFGNGRLLYNGTDMELKGKIFTQAGGNLAGWDIGSSAITKIATDDSNNTYQAVMQAPSEIQLGHAAFGIKKTDTSGNSEWPFVVHYSGLLEAKNARIEGDIVANSLTLGTGVSIGASKVSGLSTVATSGRYSDLSGSPDLTVYVAKDGRIGSTPAEGATGFIVSSAGLLKASNATIFGTLFSSNGIISGWTLDGSKLYKDTTMTIDNKSVPYRVFMQAPENPQSGHAAFAVRSGAGTTADPYEYPFLVQYDGTLHATKVYMEGQISAGSGDIGGWTIGSSALYKDLTITEDNVDYPHRVFMSAPSNPIASNAAFGVRKNVGTASDPEYEWPFLVRYNGSMRAMNANIKGEIHAESGTIGNVTVTGTLTGENVVVKIPNTGTISTDGFKVQNASGSLVFGVMPNAPASSIGTYRTAFNGGLTGDNIRVTSLTATGNIYEGGTLLSGKYNRRVSGMAADGVTATVSDSTTNWTAFKVSPTLTAGHRYFVTYAVEFSANSTGMRVSRVEIANEGGTYSSVGMISNDRRAAISGYSTYLRAAFWIQPSSNDRTLSFEALQNSGSDLSATLRYQIIDIGE